MIVLGAAVVCWLVQPRRPDKPGTSRRVAELRAARTPEAIRALAESRALATAEVRTTQTLTRRGRWVRGGLFAAVALALGTVAHRLAEDGWPPLWVLGAALIVLGAAGWLAYGKVRKPWQWAALVAGSQLLLNAAFSAVAIFAAPGGASNADWARLLFCYHAGAVPSSSAISAARKALGPGAAKLLPSQPSGLGSVLIWAAIAHFVAAVLLALYVTWGERLLGFVVKRGKVIRRRPAAAPRRAVRQTAAAASTLATGARP